ncbi:NAD(P)/FAD-dependent oxidoreductase [Marinobacter salinexigens]|uniref:NAD(P)/FAD-dependent oxidoreductase n=1 Tax=Marinobacter salinexigens TaxID=2919747 RepID=A0A5B0VR87_9GAMM|nr:NAD(P)/FAD-dependent oxidoreductase [Marinobacter salinexigens]KAA1176441.1 NAD(P)/FAD-dependent oxidoreductase [Marinobacter salinexigens]
MTREETVPGDVLLAQTVVIGAGVVGLAVARTLAQRGQEVLVLEAGPRFGEGTSSRNSEVIHAGIYYPAGSLKARMCVEGRQRLYDYCERRKVGYRRCGKWIIGSGESQRVVLEGIRKKAAGNGVHLEFRNQKAVEAQLPGVHAVAGLWSAETGIVDSHGLMLSLLGELHDAGGQFVCEAPVVAASTGREGHRLSIGGRAPCTLIARRVVNCAGLGAVRIAQVWEGLPERRTPQQWLAKGVYFSYSGRHPFSTLVYPVPEPGGLGIHLTLDLAGQARFGPDVEWIESENYHVDPVRSVAFAEAVGQWWPGLDAGRLQPAYAGIRPKLCGPGEGPADFRIDGQEEHGVEGLVNLFGIESPGLTSCLAIAELVAAKLD